MYVFDGCQPTCSALGPHVVVNGKECLNLATFNFLGFIENKQVQVRCGCLFSRVKRVT